VKVKNVKTILELSYLNTYNNVDTIIFDDEYIRLYNIYHEYFLPNHLKIILRYNSVKMLPPTLEFLYVHLYADTAPIEHLPKNLKKLIMSGHYMHPIEKKYSS